MDEKLNQHVIENFLKRTGNRGAKILSVLGKNQQFVNALESPIGQELLQDIVMMLEERLTKIANEEFETQAEEQKIKAEYRVLRELNGRFITKLNTHKDLLMEVLKNA